MKKHRYFLIIFLCFGTFYCFAQMKFNNSGQFKIAQFTDIHWDQNADNCTETLVIIKNVIKTEKPDFIILTGDIVTSKSSKEGWISIAKTFSEAKIPWGVLMGNHDPELDMTRQEIYDFLKAQPYYIGDIGPKEIHGTGNFLVPIQNSKNDKIAATLYCLDSNDYAKNELKHGRYDWIHFDQIQWYRNNSQKLSKKNGGKPLPSLAYFHIPLPEYNELIKGNEFYGAKKEERASSSKINSGFFSSILEMKDIMGTFVGHDHNNSFIGIKNDIALGYGRVSGLNAYGTLQRGARIVMMYEGKFQFDTWIRTNKGVSELFYYPSGITKEEEDKSVYHQAISIKSPMQGVNYKYYEYEGKIRSALELEDTKTSKLIKQGTLKNFSLKPMQRNDFFGMAYNAWLKIPKDGVYKFYAYSDDGSKVFIDDTLVVDNDGSHSAQRVEGKIALKAGYHKMKVLYFESYMGESIEIGISSRDITEMLIPNDMLYITQ